MWYKHTARPAVGPLLSVSLCAFALLAAAGCGRKEEALFSERTTVSAPAVPASANAPPPYVGEWARSAGECPSRKFVFTQTHLQAPSGSSCDVSDAKPSPAGFSLTALCRLQGSQTPGRLILTFEGPGSGPRNAMTIEGGPLEAPLSLVRCGGEKVAAAPSGAG